MPESALKRKALATLRHAVKLAMGLERGAADTNIEAYVVKIARLVFRKASDVDIALLYTDKLPDWITSEFLQEFMDKPEADAPPNNLVQTGTVSKYSTSRAFDKFHNEHRKDCRRIYFCCFVLFLSFCLPQP